MDSFIEEIKEELKRDQMLKIWKDYGNYIIGALLAMLLAGIGYAWWEHAEEKNRIALATTYESALMAPSADQTAVFEKMAAQTSRSGYQVLAAFKTAAASKDPSDAYRALAKDPKLDSVFQDLARLKAISIDMAQNKDPQPLLDEITLVTKKASPFRDSAFEMEANLLLALNEQRRAMELYKSLAQSEAAPLGVRQRAQVMLDLFMNH